MGKADPRIDRYFDKDRPWRAELVALRRLMLAEDVTEALKWRNPCYAAHGSNIGIIGAEKNDVALSFFKGVLFDDPAGLLKVPGPNSRSARVMKFTSTEEIDAVAQDITGFIKQAIAVEKDGRSVDLPEDDLDYPEALLAAFEADPELQTAFEALTPGRQRGYVLHISGAKQEATQHARIAKWRDRILAGQGMHDR
ncbi:YdeI family protein [Sulfitobacter porphyrae]|uniref:YdeI family protein n=1 Tax=Sulfitobacter porphyrae TaxID=1246864 RepID=A0ABW2AZI7_9RHOB|nr:hypothetical protein GCM10007928_12790 [Sulfitobacter porphyrae]